MRDSKQTREHYAEVTARWILEGSTATILELKKHTQNPCAGYTPFWRWAVRNSRDELADIDVRRFCDLLGAKHPYPDTGADLWEVLRDAGYTCFRNSSILVILDKGNPFLAARAGA